MRQRMICSRSPSVTFLNVTLIRSPPFPTVHAFLLTQWLRLRVSKGKLVASDTPENLERYLGESGLIEIETRTEASKVKEVLKNVPGIEKVSVKTDASGITSGQIREKRGQDIREELFTTFAEKKMPLLKLNAVQVSLEDVFMELTQSDKAAEEFARKAKEAEKGEVSNAGDL